MKSFICSLIMCGLAAAMFSSCDEKEENVREPFNFSAPVYINGVDRTLKNARYGIDAPLTAAQICRLDSVWMTGSKIDEYGYTISMSDWFTFEYNRIDTINNRFIFYPEYLKEGVDDNPFIDPTTGFKDFILVRHVYEHNELGRLTVSDLDTLAYIPNHQRYEAYEQIKELWEEQDWEKIYEIYTNAFTFIPCTAQEFKELQERGEN